MEFRLSVDEDSQDEHSKMKKTKPSAAKGKKRASSDDDEGSADEGPKRKKSRSKSTSKAVEGLVKATRSVGPANLTKRATRRVGPANLSKTKSSKDELAVRKSPRKTKKVSYALT